MRFEFATAQRVIFGEGTSGELGSLARSLGKRALVVTGRCSERHAGRMASQDVHASWFSVHGEPTVEQVREGAGLALLKGADLVIAIGGGSALDAGKAIAALAANPGDPMRYLEVIGEGRPLEQHPLPMIAVPTTAGTGSEVTRNAVLLSQEHGVKVSLRHEWMLPRIALVDPELTYGLPPEVTAATGLDALTQLIEPFVCAKANPMTDALCRDGLRRAARSLKRAWEDGMDRDARRDMALASLMGGLALANAGLGAVHGLAAPLGGLKPVPHGVACAALLPHVMEANLLALPTGHPAQEKYGEIARILTGRADAKPMDAVDWVVSTVRRLQVPRLGAYGLGGQDLGEVARRALVASSMKVNPVALDMEALIDILARAM